jgi:hypothetical protein
LIWDSWRSLHPFKKIRRRILIRGRKKNKMSKLQALQGSCKHQLSNSRIFLTMLLERKTFLELSRVGRVVLLSHHCTCKGREDLYKSCLKLQRGDLIFNHLEAQYSLLATRPGVGYEGS